MAELCRFLGIVIYMYGMDHNPPHFHFIYGDFECIMYLDGYIVEGKAPSKVIKRVEKWARANEKELFAAWDNARRGEPMPKLKPL